MTMDDHNILVLVGIVCCFLAGLTAYLLFKVDDLWYKVDRLEGRIADLERGKR